MENQEPEAVTKETEQIIKIGKNIFTITSVFAGKKDLSKTLEKLAIKRIVNDFIHQSEK